MGYGSENSLPRVAGHAMRFTEAGKFNHTIKPRCKCGWSGAAGNKSQARSLYRDHLNQVLKGTWVPGPFDQPIP